MSSDIFKESEMLVEEKIPTIRIQKDDETTPQYLNYVFGLIEGAFEEPSMINITYSPVMKIWKLSAKPTPYDLDDISNLNKWIRQIQQIQKSLSQRKTFEHKICFYLAWEMYEDGDSWNKIYNDLHKLHPFKTLDKGINAMIDSDRDEVIRGLRKLSKRFNWQRKKK